MNKKKFIEMYRQWRRENSNRKPNRVIVKMKWDDEDKTYIETIGIESPEHFFCHDDPVVLSYASTLDGLWDMAKPGNGLDFVVIDFLEFWKK